MWFRKKGHSASEQEGQGAQAPPVMQKPDLSKVKLIDLPCREEAAPDPASRQSPPKPPDEKVQKVIDALAPYIGGKDGGPATLTRAETIGVLQDAIRVIQEDKTRDYAEEKPLEVTTTMTGRLWQTGTVEPGHYTYEAKVWNEASEHGIDGGNVSNLVVKDDNGEEVAHFDRGWIDEPYPESEASDVSEAIVTFYRDHAHEMPVQEAEPELPAPEAAASHENPFGFFQKGKQAAPGGEATTSESAWERRKARKERDRSYDDDDGRGM